MSSKQKAHATAALCRRLEKNTLQPCKQRVAAERFSLVSPAAGGGRPLGPNMPSSGTSMSRAKKKDTESEMEMMTANCRSAIVAVSHSGSAVATVEIADDSTGVPISIVASLHACHSLVRLLHPCLNLSLRLDRVCGRSSEC